MEDQEKILNSGVNGMDSLGSQISTNMKQSFGKSLNALRKLQHDTIKLEAEFFQEVHSLECKFTRLYTPLNEKRAKIVSGEYLPNEEECAFPNNGVSVLYGYDYVGSEVGKFGAHKGIPKFWLIALKHTEIFEDMIEAYDEPALEHLCDITIKVSESNPMGFTLEFHFDENEYFHNAVLTKEYEMRNVVSESDPFNFEGPEIIRSKGCVIDWKSGKDLTLKTVKHIQRNRGTGAGNAIYKTANSDSFFNFFDPVVLCVDDCEDENTKLLVTSDFEVGHFIRERFIPRAALYYTGEILSLGDDAIEDEDMTLGDDDEEEIEVRN